MPLNDFGPGQAGYGMAQYLPMILAAMNQGQEQDPYKSLLDTLHGQVTDTQGQAEAARQQLGAAQATPAQQVGPGQAGLATLMGGVSSVLAPQLQGNQMAQSGIANKNQDFADMRKERLTRMENHYEALAKRADQLGNTELSLRMSAKAESIKSQMEKQKDAATLAGTMSNADANRQNALAVEAMRQKGDRETLSLQLAAKGLNPDGTPKPVTMQPRDFLGTMVNLRKQVQAAGDDDAITSAAEALYSHQMSMMSTEQANPADWVRRISRIQPMKINKPFWRDKQVYGAPDVTTIADGLASHLSLNLSDRAAAQKVVNYLEIGLRGVKNPATGKPYTPEELSLATGWVLPKRK